MKLSIAVITMNRASQLCDALNSCFNCNLPKDTQFVIIDNNSSDNTENVVFDIFKENNYEYYYEKLPQNLGVGGGRNYAFSKAKGDFVYFLDDDAYIESTNSNFFYDAINIFESDNRIMTLTTQIYDLLWKDNRVSVEGPKINDNLYLCLRFCGGSHFLRKSFWNDDLPYFPNKYGLEEILPSLTVYDKGGINVFKTDLLVIHNPKVNKWDPNTKVSKDILMMEIANKLAMKKMIYPKAASPLLYLTFLLRCLRTHMFSSVIQILKLSKSINKINVKRIKMATIYHITKIFGFSVF